MSCKQWDVCVVPFPFVDSAVSKPRPVLIVSKDAFQMETGHCLAAMITTGSNTAWSGDTPIQDLKPTGLTTPSLIRLKLFTLDMQLSPRHIGELSNSCRQNFLKSFSSYILSV